MLKQFLNSSHNIEKDSFIWNMAGSMLNAFQSVIMLMILTRVTSLYEAGLFTIAYANANLFLKIGLYGMRNFQVSDTVSQFSFKEYKYSRYLTTLVMLAVSVAYIVYAVVTNNYSTQKALCVLGMCLFKLVDSIEDVYHSLYQQKGRLDIAGKCMTVRMGITLIAFTLCLILFRTLTPAIFVTTAATTIIFLLFTRWTYPAFRTEDAPVKMKRIFTLFRLCFPLFLGTFLAFYIGNAPKYAIDSQLNEEIQACYGFIAMPVFVIGLLNNFIFNPMIAKMSVMWKERDTKRFTKLFLFQVIAIFIITAICEAGAYFIGIPVLSFMYNTDLSPYRSELLVMLLGGGFLALSGLLVTIITIMRLQKLLSIGYIIVSVGAYILSPALVSKYKIMGASVLYLLLMVILCVLFFIPLLYGLSHAGKE